MRSKTLAAAVVLMMFVLPRVAVADCGVERWPVKVAADVDAATIGLLAMPSSIATLRAMPAPRPLPQEQRLAPVEVTKYSVTATMTAYRIAPDGNVQMVLADELGRTMVAQIPSAACSAGSRFLTQITDVRRQFDSRYPGAPTEFREVRVPVEVQGVGFFDFHQGQRGLAPNGLSLVPVLSLNFRPSVPPKAPPATGRRRAAGPPGRCLLPTFTISASEANACSGEATVSWSASSASTVSIDGIGTALPPTGSRILNVATNTAFAGRASNACGTSFESVAVVRTKPAATQSASLTGPGSARVGNNITLSIAINGLTEWTIRSFLGNSITPPSGTSSTSVQYAATRVGTDTVTLVASGGPCGTTLTRSMSIVVSTAPPPPPPPPPPPTGIRCCDGTRSPSCMSCSSIKGCCSGHGGVCDCGKTAADSDETARCSID